jgi:hypothetical protein
MPIGCAALAVLGSGGILLGIGFLSFSFGTPAGSWKPILAVAGAYSFSVWMLILAVRRWQRLRRHSAPR